jgi:two-component system NtrC family sensor kinase
MAQPQQLNPQADDLLRRIDELEQRLDHTRSELETSGQLRTLGLLAGAIAHEFNNILTPVLSYARVALDAPDDAELSRRALEKAADGVERASRLAKSVLNLAGRGSGAGHPPRCHPASALRAALDCLDQPLAARGISLKTEIDSAVELMIHQTDLEHVLLNLLINAVRALGDGGGVIEVACRAATGVECSTWNTPAAGALLEVRDSGPGVDPALLPTLFEPFQKRASRAAPRQGNGLGLAICRHLVEAVGGSITLRTDVPQGAAFVVMLPTAAAPAQRAA